MILAYLDEIGETGAFVSRSHPRYNTSPAFGYAGFIIPAQNARKFGQAFTEEKRKVFATEIAATASPARWERKGSSIFRTPTLEKYPQQIRVFNGLIRRLRSFGENLFYYADEKPCGTPKQTRLDQVDREAKAMRETLNRLARHVDGCGKNLLVMMDQVNEKQRIERMPTMYAHMFSRAGEFEEMKRIVEPPMHIDSSVSSNIQFADWVAACVARAVDYQLIKDSEYRWVTDKNVVGVQGSFTKDSKIHLWKRAIGDIHNSQVFHSRRPLYPRVEGQSLEAVLSEQEQRKMRALAERNDRLKRAD